MGSENKDLGQSIIRAGGPITAPDILENLSETSFNIFALGPHQLGKIAFSASHSSIITPFEDDQTSLGSQRADNDEFHYQILQEIIRNSEESLKSLSNTIQEANNYYNEAETELDEIEQDIHNQLAEIDNTTEAISLDNGKRVYLNINGDYIYANGEAIEDEDREEVRRRAQELNQRGMRVRTTQEQARYNELTQALTEAHTIRQEMQRDRGEFEQIQRDANSGKIDANEANERVRSRQEEMRDRLEEVKRHTMPASHTSIFTQIDAEEETEPKTGLSNEFHSANLDSIDDDNNPIIDNTISEEIEHDGLSSTTEESPDNQSFFGKINLG